MKYLVTMPSLGADMDSGRLVEWKIKPGDVIKKGQAIAVVETQKAAVEIESFRDGKIVELTANEGATYDVGSPIAVMEVAGEVAADIPSAAATSPVKASVDSQRIKISPAARRLAEKEGLSLESLKATDAVIELKDIEAMLHKPAGISNIREAIARQMTKSKAEIPHYYLSHRIRVDRLLSWVEMQNAKRDPEARILVPALMLNAVVRALKFCPDLNGIYNKGHFQPSSAIHLGVAVALKSGGVMVPAILDAQDLRLEDMNRSLKDLAERARKGGLKNREMTEGTITVTNVGDLGAHEVVGVIFPPQVAIVGLGRIRKEPVVDGDSVRPGFVIDVTLSADHRVTDGIVGSRFLNKLEQLIMNPEAEWTK